MLLLFSPKDTNSLVNKVVIISGMGMQHWVVVGFNTY